MLEKWLTIHISEVIFGKIPSWKTVFEVSFTISFFLFSNVTNTDVVSMLVTSGNWGDLVSSISISSEENPDVKKKYINTLFHANM